MRFAFLTYYDIGMKYIKGDIQISLVGIIIPPSGIITPPGGIVYEYVPARVVLRRNLLCASVLV